jgi:FdhD protein
MISPVMLEEFVTGFLYTERIIRKLEDIESLHIEEKSAGMPNASVLTKKSFFDNASSKTVLSGCGGDTSYLDPDRLPKIQSDTTIELSIIKNIVKETLVSAFTPEQEAFILWGFLDQMARSA